jgi:hypothetical protein
MSLAAAKYITKYTHNGQDRATVEIQQRDKVSQFRDSQYIGANSHTPPTTPPHQCASSSSLPTHCGIQP